MLRHRFIFPIDNLKKEVEKRTSKLGQMRGTDDQPHLLERLSLTDGESFMADEFLQDAAAETYDWIKAFGRRVKNAYRYVPKMEMKEVVENWGVKMTVEGERVNNLAVLFPVTSYHAEQNPVYQMYSDDAGSYFDLERYPDIDEEGTKWGWKAGTMVVYSTIYPVVEGTPLYLNSENPQEVGSVYLSYEPVGGKKTYSISGAFDEVLIERGKSSGYTIEMKVFWTTGVERAPFKKQQTNIVVWRDSGDKRINNFEFEVELPAEDSDFGAVTIDSVDSVELRVYSIAPQTPVTLDKGDYVEYESADGYFYYGIIAKSGLPIVWEECYLKDFNNSIVFEVELPNWVDQNMIPSAERHLKEALVNYVIWKWLEYVYPKEAEVYEEKFEEKGHQAQLALNTENHVLQRSTGWLH